MAHKITGLILVCFMAMTGLAMAEPTSKEEAAVTAAQTWLAKIDSANYEASWKDASAYFQNVLTQEQWVVSLKGVRAPLGKLGSRKLQKATSMTALPGAPDGEYVVVLFDSSFENKATAVETVTLKRDADGQWRSAGYFIR